MAAIAPTFDSGYALSVTADAVVLPITKFSVMEENGLVDVTNSLSLGFQQMVRGITKFSGTFEAVQKISIGAPALTAGNTYAVTQTVTTAGVSWAIDVIIKSLASDVSVSGEVKHVVSWESNDTTPTLVKAVTP